MLDRSTILFTVLCNSFLLQVASVFDRDFIYDISRAAKDKFPMLIIVRCGRKSCTMLDILEGTVLRIQTISYLSSKDTCYGM